MSFDIVANSSTGFDISLGGVIPSGTATSRAGVSCSASGKKIAVNTAISASGASAIASGRKIARNTAIGASGVSCSASGAPVAGIKSGTATSASGVSCSANGLKRAIGVATSKAGASGSASGIKRATGSAISASGVRCSASGTALSGIPNGTATSACGVSCSAFGIKLSEIQPQIRGGGIDHQIKRKKATLAEKPNLHLDKIIEKAFKTVFGELTDKKIPKEIQKQANKIVKNYTDEYRPKVNDVDWESFNQDLEAVQLLFSLYQKEIAASKKLFDLIENDNVEFLLMH